MNLEDLRAAQADERGTDSLQPLPATFYEQAAAYLAERRRQRDRLADRADDPFGSAEVRRLTDEIETAEEVVEAIYERRVGKVVKRASLAAAGVSIDDEGLTDEERSLFVDLVARIRANRAEVLDALDAGETGDRGATEPADAGRDAHEPPTDDSAGGSMDASSAMGAPAGPDAEAAGASEREPEAADDPSAATADPSTTDPSATDQSDPADDRPEPDGGATPVGGVTHAASDQVDDAESSRVTVRITAEVGEIYGVDDRVYTLGREDVVSLPEPNAEPLLDRGAAQRLD